MTGGWVLHKEDRQKFWSYPVKRTRFKKRLVVQNGTARQALSGRYRTYFVVRTWYSTDTREFLKEVEEVRSFADETAEGYAVYDWINDTTHLPSVATNEVPAATTGDGSAVAPE